VVEKVTEEDLDFLQGRKQPILLGEGGTCLHWWYDGGRDDEADVDRLRKSVPRYGRQQEAALKVGRMRLYLHLVPDFPFNIGFFFFVQVAAIEQSSRSTKWR
jgi:hypothetical protein